MKTSMYGLRLALASVLCADPAKVIDLGAAIDADNAIRPESQEDVQKRKERLLKSEEQMKKDANDKTSVPDSLIGLAQREIRECWKEFSGKGGVWELQKRAREKLGNISDHILSIAKAACTAAEERHKEDAKVDVAKLASAMFRNAMAQAEASLRGSLDLTEEEAEAKLDAFLNSSWAVYKSKAKKGLDGGFNANDYPTLNQMDEAVKQSKKASSTGTRDDSAKDKPKGDADVKTDVMDTAEIVAKDSGKVQGAVTNLLLNIRAADLETHEDKLVNILNNAAREIGKLAKQEAQAPKGAKANAPKHAQA
jgi:hypothetical protein